MYGNPTAADLAVLRSHRKVTAEVYILDNNRRYLADATTALVDGTVDMDASAAVTRSCKVRLLDPSNRLAIDPNGGTAGPEFYNRMIQIIYRVDLLGGSSPYAYRCPLITGPITDVKRDGAVLTVEGSGMEILAQDGMLGDHTWPAGWGRSDVIKNALGLFTGEVYFQDSTNGGTALRAPWSVQAGDNLWEKLKTQQADAMSVRLFYDGNGVCRLSPKTTGPTMILDSTWLTENPDASFDISKVFNVCRVEGAAVKTADGTEVKLKVEAWPPPQHPFSPQSLARNGYPRVIPHFISDDSLKDFESMWEIAWPTMSADLLYSTEAQAVTTVIPFLEEYDVVTVSHPRLFMSSPVTKWTIPLVGDAEMSLNFFSTSSKGSTAGAGMVSNANLWGRLNSPGVKHGPSGAFGNGLGKGPGTKGETWYSDSDSSGAPKPNKGKKGKKGNRSRGGGKSKGKR